MRNDPTAVMIFAAGFGTRMGELTRDKPKPLIEVAGEPLLDHALKLIEGHGADKTVVNLHYKAKMIRDHLLGRSVTFSDETAEILETGGGLKAALPLLGTDPVFTMNSDAVWSGPNPLNVLRDAWDPDKMDALLLCVPPENAVGHAGSGDFRIATDGRLSREGGLVYSGAQIIKTSLVAAHTEEKFSLNVVWDKMLDDQTLFGIPYTGCWCDVGHPEGVRLAEEMLEGRNV